MMKLTPCKLKEIVREEVQRLSEDEIGWDNLPDGWDEDSLDSFARSLTDKTKNDSEGFFSACMDEVEDKFDDPEAFCASLKDEYLDTTDWRGESTNKPKSMKLTESRLRSIIREEISRATSSEKRIDEGPPRLDRQTIDYETFKNELEGAKVKQIVTPGSSKIRFMVRDGRQIADYKVKFASAEKNGNPLPRREIDGGTKVTNVLRTRTQGKFGTVASVKVTTSRGNEIKMVNPTRYTKQPLRPSPL